jgi:hypothetical protein
VKDKHLFVSLRNVQDWQVPQRIHQVIAKVFGIERPTLWEIIKHVILKYPKRLRPSTSGPPITVAPLLMRQRPVESRVSPEPAIKKTRTRPRLKESAMQLISPSAN